MDNQESEFKQRDRGFFLLPAYLAAAAPVVGYLAGYGVSRGAALISAAATAGLLAIGRIGQDTSIGRGGPPADHRLLTISLPVALFGWGTYKLIRGVFGKSDEPFRPSLTDISIYAVSAVMTWAGALKAMPDSWRKQLPDLFNAGQDTQPSDTNTSALRGRAQDDHAPTISPTTTPIIRTGSDRPVAHR